MTNPDLREALFASAVRVIQRTRDTSASVGAFELRHPELQPELADVRAQVTALALAVCDLTGVYQASTETLPPFAQRA